jgi:hypothetical protein
MASKLSNSDTVYINSHRPHLYILTPCYGNLCTINYVTCLLATVDVLFSWGIKVNVKFCKNDSLITRARNNLLAIAMADPDTTHIMFIDSDISWTPYDIVKLIVSDKALIGGVYPLKKYHWNRIVKSQDQYQDQNQNQSQSQSQSQGQGQSKSKSQENKMYLQRPVSSSPSASAMAVEAGAEAGAEAEAEAEAEARKDSSSAIDELISRKAGSSILSLMTDEGIARCNLVNYNVNYLNDTLVIRSNIAAVRHIPTGFMMIQRKTIETLYEYSPHTKYIDDVGLLTDAQNNFAYALFDCAVVERHYLSENWYFCSRWTATGGDVHVDVSINLTDTGTEDFVGCFASSIRID